MTPQKTNEPLDDIGRLVRKAQLFATRILRSAKAGDIKIENATDATKLLQSIASLSRSACELERIRFEKSGALKAALEALSNDVRVRLDRRPDLQRQIQVELCAARDDLVADYKKNLNGQIPSKTQALMMGHLEEPTVADSAKAADVYEDE